MVNANGNILSLALNQQLVALQNTARSVSVSQQQLSTGRRVNSAIDNPQNFFQAFSLTSRASDLNQVIDGLAQNVRTIQEAQAGLKLSLIHI